MADGMKAMTEEGGSGEYMWLMPMRGTVLRMIGSMHQLFRP
jgi:hypothetical protein